MLRAFFLLLILSSTFSIGIGHCTDCPEVPSDDPMFKIYSPIFRLVECDSRNSLSTLLLEQFIDQAENEIRNCDVEDKDEHFDLVTLALLASVEIKNSLHGRLEDVRCAVDIAKRISERRRIVPEIGQQVAQAKIIVEENMKGMNPNTTHIFAEVLGNLERQGIPVASSASNVLYCIDTCGIKTKPHCWL